MKLLCAVVVAVFLAVLFVGVVADDMKWLYERSIKRWFR
jgi:hypothetical protein